jgi:hypothetical protein
MPMMRAGSRRSIGIDPSNRTASGGFGVVAPRSTLLMMRF